MDDFDFSWGLDDYGSDYSADTGYLGDSSGWDVSDVDANAPWTGYTGDSGSGLLDGGGDAGSGSGSDYWSKWLMNAGLSAAGGYLQGSVQQKLSKEDWKAKTQFMKDQLAEQEKYYQAHGKQLQDAYAGYAKYETKPTAHGPNNPTSLFGLLAPRTPETDAVNGFAFDPEGAYPTAGGGLAAPVYGHSPHGY